MLFDIINKIEVIVRYNNGKRRKKSFSYPEIMTISISIIKGNINRTIGAIVSTKAFFLSCLYNGITILLRRTIDLMDSLTKALECVLRHGTL